MYIPNDETQNYPFCILKLVVETFEHSNKWIYKLKFNKNKKLLSQLTREHYHEDFED